MKALLTSFALTTLISTLYATEADVHVFNRKQLQTRRPVHAVVVVSRDGMIGGAVMKHGGKLLCDFTGHVGVDGCAVLTPNTCLELYFDNCQRTVRGTCAANANFTCQP